MLSRGVCFALLLSALIVINPAWFGGAAAAGTVDIFSNLVNESNNITGTDIAIPVSPAWAPEGPGYVWVSYANTGCNTFVAMTGVCTPGPANPAGTSGQITWPGAVTPTAIFYKTFTITDASDSGDLDIWADDTARVWLDPGNITSGDGSGVIGGSMLIDANPNQGKNCASGPIGCVPGMDAVLPLNLTTGTYTLVIDAYQFVGGSPFGVMYDGVLTDSSVPEPATLMLMGFGLAGLGLLTRRRRRN
jgi:hypothetical protein